MNVSLLTYYKACIAQMTIPPYAPKVVASTQPKITYSFRDEDGEYDVRFIGGLTSTCSRANKVSLLFFEMEPKSPASLKEQVLIARVHQMQIEDRRYMIIPFRNNTTEDYEFLTCSFSWIQNGTSVSEDKKWGTFNPNAVNSNTEAQRQINQNIISHKRKRGQEELEMDEADGKVRRFEPHDDNNEMDVETSE